MTKKLLMANEAFAHAALEAGVAVVAGYPGTPSSEVVEAVAKLRAAGVAPDVYVEWSTNEKAALEVAIGAAQMGKRAMFTCKQVGLNVASDALLSLVYIGVKGGLVLYVADDPGPISSQTEQDTRRFAPFAKLPVLDPTNPEEGVVMIKAAFDLSEKYQTPVIVRSSTRVAHASTFFEVQDKTEVRPAVPGSWEPNNTNVRVTLPAKSYFAHKAILEGLDKIAVDFTEDPTLAVFNTQVKGGAEGEPTYGIATGGVSGAYAREALRLIEEDAAAAGITVPAYKFLAVGTPYPWPAATIDAFLEGLTQVYAYEELDNVVEDGLIYSAPDSVTVRGKLTGEALLNGENSVDDAYVRLAKFLGLGDVLTGHTAVTYDGSAAEPLPTRPPVLCPGCPHRGSFYAVKNALKKAKKQGVFCGDIGCYTLGAAAPLCTIETCLCMGAGITMAQGFAVADPGYKALAFVGDSTFFASGLTGVVNAVYNQHDITVCVLDNSTTAMTGAQPHPGTGYTMMGNKHDGISIEGMLKAMGVECVITCNPLDQEEAQAAADKAINFEGPSAIVFKSPCIQLIKKGTPMVVDTDLCSGCKRCITTIGCPGIAFDTKACGPKSGTRGQAVIDADQCNGCGLCAQLCAFDAIKSLSALSAEKGGADA